MTIRNIPDETYEGLQMMAKLNHRSLQEQVRLMLIEEAKLSDGSVSEAASAYRTRLSGRTVEKSVVDDLRKDRSR